MNQSSPKLGPLGGEEQGDCAGDAAAPEAGGPGHVLGGGGEVQLGLRGLHSPRRCGLHIKGDRRRLSGLKNSTVNLIERLEKEIVVRYKGFQTFFVLSGS